MRSILVPLTPRKKTLSPAAEAGKNHSDKPSFIDKISLPRLLNAKKSACILRNILFYILQAILPGLTMWVVAKEISAKRAGLVYTQNS